MSRKKTADDERHRVAERLREQPQWTIDTEFLEMLGYLCDAVYGNTDGEIDPYMWGLQRDLADLLDGSGYTRCEDCRFADTLSCMPGRVLCKRNNGVWRPGDSCSRSMPGREGDVADAD